MGIRDLFKKKESKDMSLREKLQAGLITYDEAQDDNACEMVKSYLHFVRGRRATDTMIISTTADAVVTSDELVKSMKRGAGISEILEVAYETKSKIHTIDSIRRNNNVTNIASFKHGSFTLECARATTEIATGEKELDLNDFVDRCLREDVVNRARSEVNTYNSALTGKCPLPEFERVDIEGFIGAILVMEENIDKGRDVFNENLYLLKDGKTVERDNLVLFQNFDLDLVNEAKKISRQNYTSLLDNHYYNTEDALSMMAQDIDEGITRFDDLTKQAEETNVFYDSMYQKALRKEYLKRDRFAYNAFKKGYPEISKNQLILACASRGLLLDDISKYLDLLDEFTEKEDAFFDKYLEIKGVDYN